MTITLNQIETLCVDLDGTLIVGDSTKTLIKIQISKSPKFMLSLLRSSFTGRHTFKEKLAQASSLKDVDWKLNERLIDFLERAHNNGSKIYLVTGSSETVAAFFYERYHFFDGCFSSTKVLSLKGRKKAQHLSIQFPDKTPIYFGDALKDVWVWRRFHSGVMVQSGVLKKCLLIVACILFVSGRVERF
jgi:hypothetical protein